MDWKCCFYKHLQHGRSGINKLSNIKRNIAEYFKMKKRTKYILGITLTVIVLVAVGASFFMLNYSLTPSQNKGRNLSGSYTFMFKEYPYIKPWVDSLQHMKALRDTFIVNAEGVKLHAIYVKAAQHTQKTAVIVHGYTDDCVRMLMIGYLYHRNLNYNILLPDLQSHGLSEGRAIQMGWKDRLDVMRWMDVANSIFGGKTEMVVHGISMGAATTMMISGEQSAPYVKCFVEDCGYTSVWDEFKQELKSKFNLPSFPLMNATSMLCQLKYGWNFKEASSLKQVKKCRLPMFFIHGDADTYVPTRMVYPLYSAKPEPKAIWITRGVEHAVSYKTYPKEYTKKVGKFVGKYIK